MPTLVQHEFWPPFKDWAEMACFIAPETCEDEES